MKRWIALLCTAVLLIGLLSVSATAENSFTVPYNLELDAKTGLMKFLDRETRTYQLMDADGTILTSADAKYVDISFDMNYPFETVRVPGDGDGAKSGLLDIRGREVIPPEYSLINVVSERWQAGIQTVPATADEYDVYFYGGEKPIYHKVTQVDFYFDGKMVGSLDRSQCETDSLKAFGAYLCVRDREKNVSVYSGNWEKSPRTAYYAAEEYEYSYESSKQEHYYHMGTGQQAFVPGCTLDPNDLESTCLYSKGYFYAVDGTVLNQTPYAGDYDTCLVFHNEYAKIRVGGKVAIVNERGEEVIPPLYDDICLNPELEPVDGYFSAVKDGKIGFVDLKGNVTCDFVYSYDLARVGGPFALIQDLTGSVIVLSAACGELPEHYKTAYNYDHASILAVQNNAGQWGVINLYGEAILPFSDQYSELSVSRDGTMAVDHGYNESTVYRFSGNGGNGADPLDIPALPELDPNGEPGFEIPDFDDNDVPVLPSADDSWTCSNGHSGNHGNFCPQCGEPKPEPAVPAFCPNCGFDLGGESYRFCPNCGSPLQN